VERSWALAVAASHVKTIADARLSLRGQFDLTGWDSKIFITLPEDGS
jgi:hypothetical protein